MKILQQVMRCSENVFRRAYKSNEIRLHDAKPLMGHKLQGPKPIVYNESTLSAVEATEKLLVLIKHNFKRLHKNGMNARDIAIILLEDPPTEIDDSHAFKRLQNYFDDLKATARKKRRMENCETSPIIKRWPLANSLKWPVVIYAAYFQKGARGVKYAKYRAQARATT